MTITKYWLAKALGSWRMFWGFCPQCDSSPPELEKCKVCRGFAYSSTENIKIWRRRYLKLLDTSRSSDTTKPNN